MATNAQLAELRERVEELETAAADVRAVQAHCSSISIEWQEVGGIRIGLDAVGNAVRVEFPDNLTNMYGWEAE